MAYRPASTAYNPYLSQAKLEQAILFFLGRANNDRLDKTKLMKLLYFADFDHFEQYEQSITGARYRKLPQGPVPDDAWSVLEAMERAGRIARREVPMGRHTQHHYDTAEAVDLSVFTSAEVATLYQVAARWAPHTTQQIVAATHGEAPWIATKDGDVIPYHLAFYRNTYEEMALDDGEIDAEAGVPDEDEVYAS